MMRRNISTFSEEMLIIFTEICTRNRKFLQTEQPQEEVCTHIMLSFKNELFCKYGLLITYLAKNSVKNQSQDHQKPHIQ